MHIPQRTCVSCRRKSDKDEFIRICKSQNKPTIDYKKKENSRGLYVCKDINCIEKLKKNKAVQRILKVEVDENFFENLKSALICK